VCCVVQCLGVYRGRAPKILGPMGHGLWLFAVGMFLRPGVFFWFMVLLLYLSFGTEGFRFDPSCSCTRHVHPLVIRFSVPYATSQT